MDEPNQSNKEDVQNSAEDPELETKENDSPKNSVIENAVVLKKEEGEIVSAEDKKVDDDTRSIKSESERSHHGTESEEQEEDDDDDDASVILEREEGDGQESTPNRKVDDDEDKRNPQYIPKRGTFYEHDDRTAVEDKEENEQTEENERSEKENSKKKVWLEKESSKWSHDRYNDQEQAPKSRSELVSTYGYDIRNEEGPPRARRRRRYGRGPNKYTRNWEDEDAYNKLPAPPSKNTNRKPKSRTEDFPPLIKDQPRSRSIERPGTAGSGDSEQNKSISDNSHDSEHPRVELSKGDGPQTTIKKSEPVRSETNERKIFKPPKEIRNNTSNRLKGGGKEEESNRGVSNARGITRARGFRGVGRGDFNRTRNQKNHQQDENSDFILSQNFTNRSINQQTVQGLEKEVPSLPQQENNYRGNKFNNAPRQTSVPPRLQAEQRGSKRYSSLRQRSLPETGAAPSYNQQQQQQHAVLHYTAEYAQQNAAPQNPQGLLPHPTSSIVTQVPTNSSQQIITVQPNAQSMGPIPHQGPANNAQLLQAPPQFANPYPQAPPAFLQPGVAPPPFIAQQAPPPQIINYAQPPQFPQPGFSNFQHQQFTPVNQTQPPELYQPQGGITYYSTQNQQVIPRAPTKRPKAAIPIIPPPEHKEPRGRGRLNQEESSVGTSQELPQDNFEVESNDLQYANDVIVQQ